MRHIKTDGIVAKPHFVLIYGQSGTGKTHLAGTLGELGSVLVIDIDDGFETLSCATQLVKARENIVVVNFEAFKDLDTAFKAAKRNSAEHWSKLLKMDIKKPFDFIVWDTWSELQFLMLEEVRRSQNVGAFTGSLELRRGIEIQHWGAITDLNKLAIRELRKCAVNQIFLMQETVMKDDLTGAVQGGPAIHGKLVQEMPAWFGTVIRTETDLTGKFKATTKSKGKFTAKNRRGEGKDYANAKLWEILELQPLSKTNVSSK